MYDLYLRNKTEDKNWSMEVAEEKWFERMYGGTLCIAQEQQFSPNNTKLEGGGGVKST